MRRFLIACAALLFLVSLPAAAESLPALVDRVVAAYGGGPTPKSIRETGTTQSLRRGSGRVERLWSEGNRFRIVIDYPAGSERRYLLRELAWQQDQPATGALRAALVLQAARIALPWRLRDALPQLVDKGEITAPDGRRHRLVEWPLEPDLSMLVDIDPASARIVRSRGRMSLHAARMEFATEYGDFVQMGRYSVASHERHYAMGQHTGDTRLERVEALDAVDDAQFRP